VAIACAKSDYDGHGNTEESQRPHYHFQMRIDGKRFIDYNDYHLPLHHSACGKIGLRKSGFIR